LNAFTTPGSVPVPETDNVVAALLSQAQDAPSHAALAQRQADEYVPMETAEFASEVLELAAGIVASGLGSGTRIALFSGTRWEFTLFDYAIWASGCAAVTVYETSSAEQVKWIVGDSESQMIICETEAMRSVFESVADTVTDCTSVFVIEDDASARLRALATDESRAEVGRRIEAISHSDLATLVYTSGTTGRPKGCILTHGNFIWETRQLIAMAPEVMNDSQRQLMFLPLAHVWARLVEVACMSSGVTIYYATGIPQLTEELAMVKPTWIFSVPRVFEKIYNAAKQRADSDGKGAIFDRAVTVAVEYSKGLDTGHRNLWNRIQYRVFDRLVYARLRSVFGGELTYAFSGGAPLGARLGHFFRGVGVTALEGYGLTETTAGTSQNTPERVKIGSVGRPFPGTTIRVADDGEVMINGGQIFSGYWKNEPATNEALDPNGWLHSGDIGEIDEEGFLTITGRKKEIIVTAGGKNVAPAVLEDRVRAHPLVSQVMVIGDAKPFIAALVTIDEDSLGSWSVTHDKPSSNLAELLDDPDLMTAIQAAINDGNTAVSHAEAIKAFRILPRDLTVDGGELTPTFKLRRAIVAERFESVITDIYR
jgi:long-chain acyl-CoA synthetase